MKYIESKKKFILRKKSEISSLFKEGEVFYTKDLKIIYKHRISDFKGIRFVPCVSKKWGKSVQRNRYKRIVREAMWKIINKNSDWLEMDLAILPRSSSYGFQGYKMQKIYSQLEFFYKKQCKKIEL